jgi:hypothetical protein
MRQRELAVSLSLDSSAVVREDEDRRAKAIRVLRHICRASPLRQEPAHE